MNIETFKRLYNSDHKCIASYHDGECNVLNIIDHVHNNQVYMTNGNVVALHHINHVRDTQKY